MFRTRLGATASALMIGASLMPVAFAQDAQRPDGVEEDQTVVLGTVTVTSTKREQNLQDIGQAVTAITGDAIKDQGLNDVEDIIGLIPGTGFVDAGGGGVPVVIIRGVGLQNFRINDTPTTAIYVDEIYQTTVAEAGTTLFDIERVEVLKGPQGGLYGRNSVGGALQIISAKPNFDEHEGYVSLNYEEYNRIDAEAAISGPINDQLAFRLSGRLINSDDTYYHSATGNFDHGAEDRLAGRAMLQYKPSDTIDILLKVHGGSDESDLPLPHPVGFFEPLGLNLSAITGIANTADGAILNARPQTASINNICSAILMGGQDPALCETLNGMTPDELGITSIYDSASLSQPGLDNSWWGASLQGEFEFGDFTFTSIAAYDEFDHGRYIDLDTAPQVQQEIDYGSQIEAWSQEFRLGFDDGGTFQWIAGISYAEDELVEDSLLFADNGILSATLGGLTRGSQAYEQTSEAVAVYGRSDWQFAPEFNLVVEARYTDEEKTFDGGTFLPQVGVTLAQVDDSETFTALSGKLGLEYSPTDNALLYASVSRGFKSGGFFGGFATSNAQLEPFDKETITAYEAGFKSDWPLQAIRVNGSVFYYDRKDVQANGLDTSGIVNIARLTNIGDVESYGAELETVWSPISQFQLQGSVAWLSSEIVESDLLTTNIFRTSTTASFTGGRTTNQPEFSGNLIAKYQDYIGSNLLGSVQVEYAYRGEQDLGLVTDPISGSFLTEDPYNLVDLRFEIGPDDRRWAISAYVNNLFDEEYRENAGGTGPAGVFEFYGAPQIWGVGFDVNF